MQKRSKIGATGQLRRIGGLDGKQVWIGMDLGDRFSEICILNNEGAVERRERIETTRVAMHGFFQIFAGMPIAVEAGTHSPWVSRLLFECGLHVTVANAREVRKIHQSDHKNDRSDSETLARILRLDPKLLAPVHHRSSAMQADLSVVRARDALVRTRTVCINSARGLVKSYGARLPKCAAESFVHRAALYVPDELREAVAPLLETIAAITTKIRAFDKHIDNLAAKKYREVARLEQVTGVGALTSLTYILTLADAKRFEHSRDVAPYLGLVPRQYDSGDQHSQLKITKAGNPLLRRLLVQSAQYILGPFGPDCDLRRFGQRMMERGGKNAKKRAVVGVARKLAVLLHHLWLTGEVYEPLRTRCGRVAA